MYSQPVRAVSYWADQPVIVCKQVGVKSLSIWVSLGVVKHEAAHQDAPQGDHHPPGD